MEIKVWGLQEKQSGYIIAGNRKAWCGSGIHDFRHEMADAVMFARACDAYKVLAWILPEEYRRVCDVEHLIRIPNETER